MTRNLILLKPSQYEEENIYYKHFSTELKSG